MKIFVVEDQPIEAKLADIATRAIVAMTSYPEEYSPADAMAAGCDAYLPKPLNTRTLPALMAELMANAAIESTDETPNDPDR